jgi:hypothetical protein
MLSRLLGQLRTGFRDTLAIADMAHDPTFRGMTTVAMNQTSIFSMGATSIDWPSETALPMTKGVDFAAPAPKTEQDLVVLITGATGFLGRAILESLTNASNVALIHSVAVRSPGKTFAHPNII